MLILASFTAATRGHYRNHLYKTDFQVSCPVAARQHFDRASPLKDLREPPVLKIDNNLDMEYGSKSAKLPATNYVAQTPPGFVLPRNQPEMTRAPTQGAKLHGYNTRNNDPHQRAEFDPPPDDVILHDGCLLECPGNLY